MSRPPAAGDQANGTGTAIAAARRRAVCGGGRFTAGQRTTFLDQACGDDQALRAEVESLLWHDSQAGADFLQPPRAMQEIRDLPTADSTDPLIGQDIGGFHVQRLIAAGGMGTVYEAGQRHPRRTVALKVMHGWGASPVVARRFQLETEILARLRHPNIAQVYQAGTHEVAGVRVPYFAMEYVPDARPITQYADECGLNTRQRLELFATVCDAVQHGHQRGVIHRDLKPGNILVGADGQPKVIDFGVARLTDADVAMTTQCTAAGQIVGTVQYMSPEQCDGDSHEIDTRSDVYSLGVVLYELLTGALPYETAGSTIYAATRTIKEQVPPKPSTKLAARNADPVCGVGPLARELRGDIDTIILKALEKDREKRYSSAGDLAADIRRYLNHEPIAARPPTRWTRAVRWVQRHPYTTTVSLCLLIGTLVLATSSAVVYFVNQRPYRFLFVRDPGLKHEPYAREATLQAFNGRLLRTWGGSDPWSVRLAELVERPRELGGGKLAVVLAPEEQDFRALHVLGVYDTRRSLDVPEWKGALREGDPLPDPHRRGYKARQFDCVFAALVDVFPEHPGKEIVACYNVGYYSQCVFPIQDLRGEVLYEIWHDGEANSCYWMSDAQQLVLTGHNSEVYWEARGYPGIKGDPHPWVVFAIRPRYRERVQAFLRTRPGDGPADPVWYKCLWPPEYFADPEGGLTVRGVLRPQRSDPGRAVALSTGVTALKAGLSWEIDEHGDEIPGTRVITDGYIRTRDGTLHPGVTLPDPALIELRDLPPILPSATRPATP